MLEKRSLTTGDIAEYCGVNFRTVIRWIKRGHLKAFQLPGRGDNRVLVKDFLAFLRHHQMPVPEEFGQTARRVLVVERDAAAADSLQRVLRGAGFETQAALDGFSAGALSQSFGPAVITIDPRAPGLGGLAAVGALRRAGGLEGTRVLVVSEMTEPDVRRALDAGADDVLPKPYEAAELVARVARLAGVDPAAPSEA